MMLDWPTIICIAIMLLFGLGCVFLWDEICEAATRDHENFNAPGIPFGEHLLIGGGLTLFMAVIYPLEHQEISFFPLSDYIWVRLNALAIAGAIGFAIGICFKSLRHQG